MKGSQRAPSGGLMRWIPPLLLCLAAPAAARIGPVPAPDGPPQMRIAPRTWQGTAFAGLTRLGETPLTTPLPAGETPLTVFAPGLYPAERTARLRVGQAVDWRPILKPPMPPPRRSLTDGGRRSGLGISAHFSPPLAETLGRVRAIAEAARDRQVLIAALGHTYDEVAGVGRRLTTQQTTRLRARAHLAPSGAVGDQPVQRARLNRREITADALGAADVLGERSPAAAELAALVNLIRWRVVSAQGVQIDVVSRTWGDDMVQAAVVEQDIELAVDGRVGAIELAARTLDHTSLARRTDGDAPVEARNGDQITARLEGLTVRVHDGVLVGLEGAPDAATARDALTAALAAAGLTVKLTSQGVQAGVPLVSAAWPSAGNSALR